MLTIALVISLGAALVAWMLYFRGVAGHKAFQDLHRRQEAAAQEREHALQDEREHYVAETISLGKELAAEKAHNEGLASRLETQAAELGRLQETFRAEFESLASRLLEEKSEKFTRQNETNIGNLLKPLQERIQEFEKKVETAYNQESRERFNLQKELGRMCELNRTLSEQADGLTKALKSDPKKQGNWGEFLLERILENCGLTEGVHFKKQLAVTDRDGMVKRPDMVILLPEHRHVIIDAKVSLTAYERYFSASDPEASVRALREHLASVRRHVDELSPKQYEKLFERSADFVLMFIPVEPAYGLALAEDSSLFAEAFRKQVILVGVSSLMATLRIIDAMWRLERQNSNAAEIVRHGSDLYDKFVAFAESLQSLGQKLEGARGEYEQAMSRLTEGRGNLVRRAEQMRQLGLDPKKRLPESWQERPGSPAEAIAPPGIQES